MLVLGLKGCQCYTNNRLLAGCTCTCQHMFQQSQLQENPDCSKIPTAAQSQLQQNLNNNLSNVPTAAEAHLHRVVAGLIEVLYQV